MDSTRESLVELERRTRKALVTAIKSGEERYTIIEILFANYRAASEDLVFYDFVLASSDHTEIRMWDAHIELNKAFRKGLEKFKKKEEKRKVVERRELEKQYERFLKSSQTFYRGYIQRLSSQFANVDEVLDVAQQIRSETPSVDGPVVVDQVQKRLVIQSCHSSLVHLGDLSRYREKESKSQHKNWGPAVGYYNLAIKVLPTSGAPYNQLAFIAQADQDTLKTVYYHYRALMAEEPFPAARGNLDLNFKDSRSSWAEPKNHNVKDGMFTNFPSRFVAFHAFCYAGDTFEEHRDLETELIHEITVILQEESDAGLLNRIALINIAAESAAVERWLRKEDPVSYNSFRLLLAFNVNFFSQLLRVFSMELRRIKKLVASSEMNDDGKFTSAVRHLLIPLRQYSSWLLIDTPRLKDTQLYYLTITAFEITLAGNVQALWQSYAEMLDLLASTYPLKGGRKAKYLLAEDEDTIGFKPFADELVNQSRYLDETGKAKPRSTDPNVKKEEPATEMLHRIHDLAKDGLNIAKSTDPERVVSVRLEKGRFVFLQPTHSSTKPDINGHIRPSQPLSGSFTMPQSLLPASRQSATSIPIDTEMRDMVDDLLDELQPKQTGPMRPCSKKVENMRESTYTAADLVRQVEQPTQSQASQAPPKLPAAHIRSSPLFPSGLADFSGSRPGTSLASQPFNTPASLPPTSSGHTFTNRIIRQKQEIQARSSPQQSLPQPSFWSNHDTPTGLKFMPNTSPRLPSWVGSPATPLATGEEEVQKPLPQRNLFGAIGDAKTPDRTPTSAQPG